MAGRSMTKSEKAIALFSGYYPSHGGGVELVCAELARGLLRAGMQVEWAAQAENSLTHDLSAHCTPLPGTDVVYALSGVPMPLPMPWALPTISRIAKRASVVVIAEANFVLSVAAFLAAKLHRKPTLLIQHVGEPSTVSEFARLVMRLGEKLATRPMVRSADAVVCVSPVVARYFEGARTKAECLTIGHGIDMEGFFLSPSAEDRAADREALGLGRHGKLACYVGRLTESKGISVIAEMARLRPDWSFAVAGKGPVEPARWNLPNVRALGQLDRVEVGRLYRGSDVTVLPSQLESFSLVVREALASGSSVLCSNQVLDTDPGLAPYITTEVVDLSDVSATAARFAAALDRLARAPREDARDYVASQCSWAGVNARYIRVIEGLLSSQSGAGP
jgi:glycosyltransferase involved in cell wall biosynthesis